MTTDMNLYNKICTKRVKFTGEIVKVRWVQDGYGQTFWEEVGKRVPYIYYRNELEDL